jgi:hypothetical protein
VRDFEEKRILALERAAHLAAQTGPGHAGKGGLGPEVPLATADGKVTGKLDIVLPTPEGEVIRDHKSGRGHDEQITCSCRPFRTSPLGIRYQGSDAGRRPALPPRVEASCQT